MAPAPPNAGCAAPSLSARLWRDAAPGAAAVVGHPFLVGLAAGTLPPARFALFTAQDTHFLAAYAAAYTDLAAAAGAPPGVRRRLTRLAAEAEAERAALPPLPLGEAPPPPSAATMAYTDFLAAAVGSAVGGADADAGAAAVAALVPCMRLYAHVGRALVDGRRGGGGRPGGGVPAYEAWLGVYAGAAFAAAAADAEAALDEWAGAATAAAAAGGGGGGVAAVEAAAERLYRRAMELEVAFFDEAWAGGGALGGDAWGGTLGGGRRQHADVVLAAVDEGSRRRFPSRAPRLFFSASSFQRRMSLKRRKNHALM
ncbi:hypothetical protein BU14_0072s0100 [Porphyra umbilicalis]|uniref:Thiaminase-2/PQQC domain-containing protein n=1 Tax=Porphyra umbilicalis TaxID=2786 RepID=A0A1X6PFV9_PORUM|nr:hypothetical protein BU14_0072s0100 [Porphyra umbilicalis]|eukprot:OSX79742.1 hypothetical protein BU14_0072s0100 [Porphyra umbilicalis]